MRSVVAGKWRGSSGSPCNEAFSLRQSLRFETSRLVWHRAAAERAGPTLHTGTYSLGELLVSFPMCISSYLQLISV